MARGKRTTRADSSAETVDTLRNFVVYTIIYFEPLYLPLSSPRAIKKEPRKTSLLYFGATSISAISFWFLAPLPYLEHLKTVD